MVSRGIAGAIASVLVLVASAEAQPLTYKFLSGSGVGIYGTYKAQLDGANIDVWCVDFLNHVGAGNQYYVNKTGLGAGVDLSKTRFGLFYGNDPTRYRQAAYLATKFSTLPSTTANWAPLHIAIWQLMTPGVPTVSASMATTVQTWLSDAAANYRKYYYHNVYVLTDVAVARCASANPANAPWIGCGKQEHIYVDGQLTVTPEPASVALLATGLVGLGGATYLKRRRKA
jgi:hypothetical protein